MFKIVTMNLKNKWLTYCVVFLGLFFAMLILTGSFKPGNADRNLPLAKAGIQELEVTVNTIGVMDAARSHMISSTIRGDEAKIIYLVDDGTRVETGDVLVKLDSAPFKEKVQHYRDEVASLASAVTAKKQILEWEKTQSEKDIQTADYNLKVAKLDLKRLTEGDGPLQVALFQDDLDNAKKELDKYLSYLSSLEQLTKQGYENPGEIDQAKKKINELKKKYNSCETKFQSYQKHVFPSLEKAARAKVEKSKMESVQIRKAGTFKIAKAMADLNEIQGQLLTKQSYLKLARSELDNTIIRASSPGIAILFETFRESEKRKPRVGDRVVRNQPILYLPDITSMIVKTHIREIDLYKVALGKKATVYVDAYPELMLEGRVSFIGALATELTNKNSGVKYFQLTIVLDTDDSRLRPGMTSRVSIQADKVEKTLCVPVQSVFTQKNKHYCYLVSGDKNRITRRKIDLGKQNEFFTEVLSGLEPGDLVSLIDPEGKDDFVSY